MRPKWEALASQRDAQLVAEAWSAGIGAVLRKHSYSNVQVFENDAEEFVAASWECSCGASEVDFDNFGEAAAAARGHWRDAIRSALEVSE